MINYYQHLMQKIHTHNVSVGWWDNTDKWTHMTKLMLTISEASEAMEGDRKNLKDDKLPHRDMLEVEVADVLIRALDLMGHNNTDISTNLPDLVEQSLSLMRSHQPPVPVVLFQMCDDIIMWGRGEHSGERLIATIHAAGVYLKLDLIGATREKMEFNATRADHKRENRAKENGKTY